MPRRRSRRSGASCFGAGAAGGCGSCPSRRPTRPSPSIGARTRAAPRTSSWRRSRRVTRCRRQERHANRILRPQRRLYAGSLTPPHRAWPTPPPQPPLINRGSARRDPRADGPRDEAPRPHPRPRLAGQDLAWFRVAQAGPGAHRQTRAGRYGGWAGGRPHRHRRAAGHGHLAGLLGPLVRALRSPHARHREGAEGLRQGGHRPIHRRHRQRR
jgi:hypothetical protein